MEKLDTPTLAGSPSTRNDQKQLSSGLLAVPLIWLIENPRVAPKLVALNWKSREMSTAPTKTSRALLPAGTATVTGNAGGLVSLAGGHSSSNETEYFTGINTNGCGH